MTHVYSSRPIHDYNFYLLFLLSNIFSFIIFSFLVFFTKEFIPYLGQNSRHSKIRTGLSYTKLILCDFGNARIALKLKITES